MNIATLRVQGPDNELAALIAALSIPIDAEWKHSEYRSKNKKYEKSGFNACIADVEYTNDLNMKLCEFLSECRINGISFMSPDIEAEIDIGIGSNEQFVSSICVPLEDMRQILDLGLEFRVSAYSCSNDE